MEAYTDDIPVVVLDAPPGSGKTLIAEMVRRALTTRATYLCVSKTLQHQVARDFPYCKVLMGRGNYVSHTEGVTCDACTKTVTGGDCWWCEDVFRCPYEAAKRDALRADCAVTNYSYFLAEANTRGLMSGQPLVICDEADLIEEELLGYVSVSYGKGLIQQCRMGSTRPKKSTVSESWVEWLNDLLPRLRRTVTKGQPRSGAEWRRRIGLERLLSRTPGLMKDIQAGTWVMTSTESGTVTFRPVEAAPHSTALWRHSARWLLMSGTVLSAQVLLGELGWTGRYVSVSVPSTFRPANRPICLTPVARVSGTSRAGVSGDTLTSMTTALSAITGRHPNESVLVHAVSYALTEKLADAVDGTGRRVYTYSTSREREPALDAFRQHSGSVLVAPSMGRGVDLPDDLCRVVVVAKVPYPYLGDRQVSARLHSRGGQLWYDMKTARALVQMTGRAVRHADDWACTYVLDEAFIPFFRKRRWLFPEWWQQALDWRTTL
jgi:Rad3-related DNA helicase